MAKYDKQVYVDSSLARNIFVCKSRGPKGPLDFFRHYVTFTQNFIIRSYLIFSSNKAFCEHRGSRHNATYRRPKKFLKKNFDFFQFFPQAGTVEENTWHIEVLLLFLSLRYGLDLGRSRLVYEYFWLETSVLRGQRSLHFLHYGSFSRQKHNFRKSFCVCSWWKSGFRVLCVSFWVFLGQNLRSFFVKGDLCGTDERFFNDRGKGLFFWWKGTFQRFPCSFNESCLHGIKLENSFTDKLQVPSL